MFLSVDRIYAEKNTAVLIDEDNIKSEVSVDILPSGIKEGIVLSFDGNSYNIDYDRTEKVKNDLKQRLENLFKKK